MREVGPGIGTLTQGLAESGADVVAVELDKRLLPVLDVTLEGYDNVRIVNGDILQVNIMETVAAPEFKVCANLPYYFTTPIIFALLEKRLPMERLVAMVQKEVAERLIRILKEKGYSVVTDVTPASRFWPAEQYHQNYYNRKGTQPYCHRYTKRF